MKIYLIRHGETDLNLQGIVQGSGIDAPLNDTGHAQAAAFFQQYKDIRFDRVITSALVRTQETVAPFIAAGIPWTSTTDINEICWGVHEGQPYQKEMVDAYDAMIAAWAMGDFDAALPGGESAAELSARVGNFIDHLSTLTDEHVLVCTHGRTMRCLVAMLKRQHLREMERVKHTNTGLYLVHHTGSDFEILLENDTRHLEAAGLGVSRQY
jgi:probable phosphoglycerate mutase